MAELIGNAGKPRFFAMMIDYVVAAVPSLAIVEVNPFLAGALPAGLAVTLSKRRQRLGDMLARSVVVTMDDWRRMSNAEGERITTMQ